ncbi:MAG: hypothetical protein ACJA07_004764 [Rhodococcus sp. (in: high G+C Gram-positive bacteria)]|jgi:hypothetical protein
MGQIGAQTLADIGHRQLLVLPEKTKNRLLELTRTPTHDLDHFSRFPDYATTRSKSAVEDNELSATPATTVQAVSIDARKGFE